MYTDFFGLREKPFALSPDPRFLYLSGSHREALAHLLYGIEEGEGFIAITGEVGTGKTTLCRTLLERLGSETEVAFLFNPIGSGIELLQAISREFGLPTQPATRADLNDGLNRFLLEKKSAGHRVLLIVDEAQNLGTETLEEIRLLSNLETSTSKLIQILLLGQPELARKLDSPELRQLRQRISVRWNLSSLSARETRDYVRHRMRVAGDSERSIFSDASLRSVYRRTGGVPRLVNVLCDRSLLVAFGSARSKVSAAIVRRAAKEIPDAGRRLGAPLSALLGSIGGLGLAGAAAWALLGSLPPASAPPLLDVRPPALPAVSSAPPGFGLAPMQHAFVARETPVRVPVAEVFTATVPPEVEETTSLVSLRYVLGAGDFPLARLEAINAVLEMHDLHPYQSVPKSRAAALAWLRYRGLSVLEVSDADLAMLETLNHPAILELASPGGPVFATLGSLDGEWASLWGSFAGDGAVVKREDLERHWNGNAWVVWQAFEPIPEVMVYGERGAGIIWLQSALTELGHYAGDASGRFDNSTYESVRAFQVEHAIDADGAAGPRTQMLLYDRLERYANPTLAKRTPVDSATTSKAPAAVNEPARRSDSIPLRLGSESG